MLSFFNPLLIYSNSLNVFLKNIEKFLFVRYRALFHLHESISDASVFRDLTTLKDDRVYAVSDRINNDLAELGLHNVKTFPPFLAPEAFVKLDASESGYLRTLALMGTVGGVLLAGVLAGMAFEIIRAFRAQLQHAELAPICNLVIAGFGTVFVVSIGEGFILGIFTLPVLYIYLLYAASAFIAEYDDLKIVDVADTGGDTDVDGWTAEAAPERS
jgi:hypothetical protein